MQTQDTVEGLLIFRELSQPPKCLDDVNCHWKSTVLHTFILTYLSSKWEHAWYLSYSIIADDVKFYASVALGAPLNEAFNGFF